VGLNSLKSLNLTNVYPNNKNNKNKNNNKKNNKVKSKPLELFELAGKKLTFGRKSTSLQKDENSFNMETDDLLCELIKGQKNMAEKFTKDLKDLAEDFVEKLTAQTKAIVTIRQDIKVIKDDIKNLTQRVDVTEKEF
jgi:hypothetical protein